eukprot:3000851-Amphidinium_carterae.1
MQFFACIVLTDHLRLHFIAAKPVGSSFLLQTRDMGSASSAKHCQNTTNEVAKVAKSGSDTQQGSQIVVPSVCADSSS